MATIASISVDLVANSAKFRRDLNKAEKDAKGFFGKVTRHSTRASKAIAGVGAAAAVMFAGKSLSTAGQYAHAMNDVRAKTLSTKKEMAGLSVVMRDTAKSTKWTAVQTAEAATYLAQAGLGVEKIKGVLRTTVDTASATGTDVKATADIVTNVMAVFGHGAQEMAKDADVMALATARSNTNLYQLGEAMKYGGPAARNFNLSIEQTTALLGQMANAGIKGSMAGTVLDNAYRKLAQGGGMTQQLLAGTTKGFTLQQQALHRYGVQTKDERGNVRNLVDILHELGAANVSTSDMIDIFGARAARGLITIVRDGTGSLDDMITTLKSAKGSVEAMSKIQMDDLVGDTKLLGSQWQEIQMIFANGGLYNLARAFVQGLINGLGKLEPFIRAASKYMDEIAIILGVLGGAATVLGIMALGSSFIFLAKALVMGQVSQLVAMGSAVGGLAVKFVQLAAAIMANPIFLIGAAIAIVASQLWFYRDEIGRAFSGIGTFIKEALYTPVKNVLTYVGERFTSFLNWIGGAAASALRAMGFDEMADNFEGMGDSVAGFIGGTADNIKAAVLEAGEGAKEWAGGVATSIGDVWDGLVSGAIKTKDDLAALLDFTGTDVSTSPDGAPSTTSNGLTADDEVKLTEAEIAQQNADEVKKVWADLTNFRGKQEIEALKNNKQGWLGLIKEGAASSKKLRKIQQAMAIASVIRDTATGVMKAVGSAPFPANIPAIAFATAQGAISLNAVKGQAHDGLANVPNTGTYLLESGERVVKKQDNRELGRFLAQANQDNRTASNTNNNELNFNVSGTNPEGLEEVLQNSRGQFETMLKDVYREHAIPSPFGA